MTALECWRRGYDVRIFEATKTNSTQGTPDLIACRACFSLLQVIASLSVRLPWMP